MTTFVTLGLGAELYVDREKNLMGIRKVVRGEVTQDIPLGTACEQALDNLIIYINTVRAAARH